MDRLRILLSRWAALFRGRALDRELDAELRSHLEFAAAEKMERGMSAEEAQRDALREFGGVTQVTERYRVARGVPFLEVLARDVRFGLRQLRKSAGFTWTVVLTLALGIGATAAMFSVVDAVVLRPLPYNDVDRIVMVKTHSASNFWQWSSWPGYLEMRRLNTSFASLAGYVDWWGMTLRTGDRTQYLNVTQGSHNFFDVFGVKPLVGRTYLPGEDQPGRNDVLVLSYEVWRQQFHGDSAIVGKTANLDGRPYTVIGVMPAGFRFPFGKPNLVYIPMHVRPPWVHSYSNSWVETVGRLRPGVSRETAQAEMAHVMGEIGQEQPKTDKGRTVQLTPITAAMHGENELAEIAVMLCAVFAVLLIACANVAGLQLARGIAREREMALRVAIGARRGRLLHQLLVENALLGAMGALSGLLLAGGLLAAMKVFLAHAFSRGANITLNLPVIAVTLGAGVLSSVAAGLIPAWRAARADPSQALKSGAATGTSRQQRRLRAGFVITQIALSLVLVVFSGVLLMTLRRMLKIDCGFSPKNLLMLGVNIPSGDYKGRNYVQEFMLPFEQRVDAIPGVVAAGFIDQPPVLGFGSGTSQVLVGHAPDPPGHERNSESRAVTPGYYRALELPMVRGRNFSAQDTPTSQPVVIVNEAWVKEFLSSKEDPVAQAFVGKPRNTAIIGVAHDARQSLPEPARPEIDFPFSEFSQQTQQDAGSFGICLFVRTAVPPLSIVPELRAALHETAPTIAFQAPDTMDDLLEDALMTNRMESWLFGIFAGIAVLLAAVGIYGLLMQEVSSQTRDIGVRMALGATPAAIARRMMLRIGGLLTTGLGTGIVLTMLLRHTVASVVTVEYGRDGLMIAALVLLLAGIGLAAAIVPTRRAASVDPIRTLRTE
ncbi:MAG TPA: ABC transporter permease [Acidobacteriaceae bacterium]